MPTSTRKKRPFYVGFPANPYWIPISPRRGGRLCPPAGIVRFYGKPMRIRNILKGRCRHRPLQTTSQNCTILEGGQGRPPLQGAMMNRNVFCFSPRRGRCPHRPAGSARFMMGFRRIGFNFPFRAVGVDAHLGAKSRALRGCASKLACGRRIDPHKPSVFMEIQCESATFSYSAL